MIKKIFSEGHLEIHSSFLKKLTALLNAHLSSSKIKSSAIFCKKDMEYGSYNFER